jgi:hypothetical protein
MRRDNENIHRVLSQLIRLQQVALYAHQQAILLVSATGRSLCFSYWLIASLLLRLSRNFQHNITYGLLIDLTAARIVRYTNRTSLLKQHVRSSVRMLYRPVFVYTVS